MSSSERTARVYARLSRKKEDSTSVARQVELCKTEANRLGATRVVEYREREGTSGYKKTALRPEFDRLMLELEAGDILLAYAQDRLSRQGVAHMEGAVLDRLDEIGARLVTLDGVDTARGESEEMMISFRAMQSRQESRNTARRVKSAADERKAAGRWHGGPLPWGMTSEDGHLKPHPETGELARQVCEWILQGESSHAIAQRLNDLGATAPRGGTWNQSQISQWAQRPSIAAYQAHRNRNRRTGRYDYRPTLYRDETGNPVRVGVGLVTLGEWYRIQTQFQGRSQEVRVGQRRGKRGTTTTFGSIVRCGRCGGPMHGSGTRNGHPTDYICGRRVSGRCAGNYAAIKHVDYWIGSQYTTAISAMEPGDDLWDAAVDGWIRREHPEALGDVEATGSDVADAEASLSRLADLLADGVLDAETYTRQRDRLSARLEKAREAERAAQRRVADVTPFLDASTLREMWQAASQTERRDLLLDVADHVVIHPATGPRFDPNRVEISWKTGL